MRDDWQTKFTNEAAIRAMRDRMPVSVGLFYVRDFVQGGVRYMLACAKWTDPTRRTNRQSAIAFAFERDRPYDEIRMADKFEEFMALKALMDAQSLSMPPSSEDIVRV